MPDSTFPLQAILFDCDGVIADSEAAWNDIDREHLQHYGVPDYRGELKPHVIGKSFALSIGHYRQHYGIEAPLNEMLAHRTEVARRFYADSIPTFESVAEVLAALKALNLKLALATSSVGPLILPFLERHQLTGYFDAIITGEMVTNGKPSPDIYLLAAKEAGVDARNALVVEDALSGLEAGRSAGCRTVAIPDPRWHEVSIFEGQSDYTIGSLAELVPLVKTLVSTLP